MSTTKELIVDYLIQHQTATAVELSRALHLTPANIRYHLANLLAEGEILEEDEMMTTRRGRPSRIYRLARPQARDTYLSITQSLLSAFQDAPASLPIKQVARSLSGPSIQEAGRHTIYRLNAAIISLTGYGHQANWIASKDGPTIELHGCPFRQIIDDYPELCTIDLEVINQSTNNSFEQVDKLKADSRKRMVCRFKLKERIK